MGRATGDARSAGTLVGGVEAGGTKLVCLVGTGPDDVVASSRIPVTDPSTTLGTAVGFFRAAIAGGSSPAAIGIGSFGPLELRRDQPAYGRITSTPKPGWSGTDMVAPFAALGVPVGFDTDVNAAALAEGRWGAARGLRSFVYLTVGTGIGGGAMIDGQLLHGLGHPEMGHVAVARRPSDTFPGSCPFHGDCLEGMASGPAIEARFGHRAEILEGDERRAAVATAAWYLGSGIGSIVVALAPERVVIGGGLGLAPGLVDGVRAAFRARQMGYPAQPEHLDPSFIVPAGLGAMAGPLGALVVAKRALADSAARDRPGGTPGPT